MLKLPFVFFPFVQFATNIKMVCDNWNISTALWLRRLENFNSFMSGKSPLYSILGNILVLFQNCIWTMFSPQDPSGVYYVICLAWILSGILYDVFVACTIHRGGKNGKYILACEPALHLGESQEFTREPHSKETRMWLCRSPERSLVVCLQVAVKKTIGYDRCFFFCFPPSPSIYFSFFLSISCCADICRTPKIAFKTRTGFYLLLMLCRFQGRRVFRPYFQKSYAMALTYDVITCIVTVLSVAEGGVPFQLLQLRMSLDYWRYSTE